MRRRLLAVLLLGALTAAACGGESDEDPLDDETGTEQPADDRPEPLAGADDEGGSDVEVELLDAGAEPRRPLRLDPPDGCEQPVTLSNRSEQTVSVLGQSQATGSELEYDVTYTCQSVEDDRITVGVRYDDARVLAVDGTPRGPLDELVGQLVGAEGSLELDRQGRILAFEAPALDVDEDVLGEGFATAMEQMQKNLEASAEQAAAPFPDEAVGVGARWRVSAAVDMAGLATRMVTELVLTELTADRAAATTSVRMELVPGPADVAGVPPGGLEILSGSFDGTGTTTWALDGVVALVEQVLDGEAVMRIDQDGETVDLTQGQHQETAVRPR